MLGVAAGAAACEAVRGEWCGTDTRHYAGALQVVGNSRAEMNAWETLEGMLVRCVERAVHMHRAIVMSNAGWYYLRPMIVAAFQFSGSGETKFCSFGMIDGSLSSLEVARGKAAGSLVSAALAVGSVVKDNPLQPRISVQDSLWLARISA